MLPPDKPFLPLPRPTRPGPALRRYSTTLTPKKSLASKSLRFFFRRAAGPGAWYFWGGVGGFRPGCQGGLTGPLLTLHNAVVMDRTNAERQRRYIERLKRKADAASRLSASSIAAALVTLQAERQRREAARWRWGPYPHGDKEGWTLKDLKRLAKLHRRMHREKSEAARNSIRDMHTGYWRGKDDLIALLLEVLGIAS